MTRKTYVYNVSREGRWWLIDVPEVGHTTQARDIPEIEVMVVSLLSLLHEQPPESFDVRVGSMDLPGGAAGRIEAAHRHRAQADGETGGAVKELHAAGLRIADIARLTGVSRRRAQAMADTVNDSQTGAP